MRGCWAAVLAAVSIAQGVVDMPYKKGKVLVQTAVAPELIDRLDAVRRDIGASRSGFAAAALESAVARQEAIQREWGAA